MPSRWEGLPLVALEAGAHGCALLTTNIGPFLELVEDGKTGRLFPVDDYRALARHLVVTQKSEWRRMGSLARDLVRKNYALQKTLRRTIQVYYALHRSDRSGIQ